MNVLVALFTWLTLISAHAKETTYCLYKGMHLNFKLVPGKVCVHDVGPSVKPEMLTFTTNSNFGELKLTKESIGKAALTGTLGPECYLELSTGIAQNVLKKYCYEVPERDRLEASWEHARTIAELGRNYIDFFKLQSPNPNWSGLQKRLDEIISSQPSSTVSNPAGISKK